MKKQYILFCGVGWCGTTSLYHSLYGSNYLTGGFRKEFKQLWSVFEYQKLFDEWGPMAKTIEDYIAIKDIMDEIMNMAKTRLNKSGISNTKWINFNHPVKIFKKFSVEQIEYYFSMEPTMEKYFQYMKDLSTYSEGNVKAVADFTNYNFLLTEDNYNVVKEYMSSEFDVKVIIILRDPIRRTFSNCSYMSYRYYNTNNAVSTFNDNTTQIKNSINDYASKIKTLRKVFGKENVHYVIMEDYFKEDSRVEVEKLEKFLNADLPYRFPCAFVPDKGINAPRLENLQDQWDSDHEKLEPEFYNQSKIKLQEIYDDFEELHGYLPADWGHPIDYGY